MSVSKDKISGFLIVDKAKGRASFSTVFRVRQCLGRHLKVGHLGTLDPLATGVLVIAIGEATKLIQYFMGLDKTYEVEAIFGATSTTYDANGEITAVKLPKNFKVDETRIREVIEQKFSSKIMQVPPAFSAKWVDGKRAYHLARKGKEIELQAVEINVHNFELKELHWPEAKFIVEVSSGAYVRSLIHDLGQELGCGAYVKELRRTKVGDFGLKNAITEIDKETVDFLIPIEEFLNKFDRIDLDDVEYPILEVGRKLDNRRGLKNGLYAGCYQDKLRGILRVNELPLPGWIKMEKTLHM